MTRVWSLSLFVLVGVAFSSELAAEGVESSSEEYAAVQNLLGRASAVDALVPREHGCFVHTIDCGETVTTRLTEESCQAESGAYGDVHFFSGKKGERVVAEMNSDSYDTLLGLLDPNQEVVAADDDGGQGTNSKIDYKLDRTSSKWALVTTTLVPFRTGAYSLSLKCSRTSGSPPGGGFFRDPEYPDFEFRVQLGDDPSAVVGNRERSCLDDTVCVSGALPGRSEVFLRILGPRPNGYLWPTIVRFTPSRAVVDIRRLSTGQENRYILPAVGPGGDDLGGLQDRTGFSASGSDGKAVIAHQRTARKTAVSTDLVDARAGGGFFRDPEFPDFLFRVQIGSGGSAITGRYEESCLPDTACISGALPGRTEAFLRIIGPRPNGFFWPTIVRFTPSRIVVEVQQISTGELKRYVLGAVGPKEGLSGRQDRHGFRPAPEQGEGTLVVAAPIFTENRVGILEVTMLLDGRQIGRFTSPFGSGAVPTIVNGVAQGLGSGRHVLEFRFDQLTSSPAIVVVAASGVFYPAPGLPPKAVDFGSRQQTVGQGGTVRLTGDL